MESTNAVVLGLVLGVRHATDPDHLAAIGAMLAGRGVRGAALTAAVWGLGHSVTFWGLGAGVVLSGWRLSAGTERGVELLVGATLVGLGLLQLARLRPGSAGAVPRSPGPTTDGVPSTGTIPHGHGALARALRWRPFLVGVVHGLAGSTAIALMALVTLPTRSLALVYLLLFGVGVVAGMMLLTVVMAWPLAWSARRAGSLYRGVMAAASLASVVMGVSVAWEAL